MGRLKVNLLSLEFLLRACVYEKEEATSALPDLTKLNEGDTTEENPMTDFSSLAEIVRRYNGYFGSGVRS